MPGREAINRQELQLQDVPKPLHPLHDLQKV